MARASGISRSYQGSKVRQVRGFDGCGFQGSGQGSRFKRLPYVAAMCCAVTDLCQSTGICHSGAMSRRAILDLASRHSGVRGGESLPRICATIMTISVACITTCARPGPRSDRRGLLRLAARAGMGVGAIQLIRVRIEPHQRERHGHQAAPAPAQEAARSALRRFPRTQGPYPADGSQRSERAERQRRRAKRYPVQLRRPERHRDRRPVDNQPDGRVRVDLPAAVGPRDLHLALRSGRPLLAVLGGRHQPELPPRHSGGRFARAGSTSRRFFRRAIPGRWPHIHFEVYPSLSAATSVANKSATSQIALPKAACDQVYATSGYEASVTNLSRVTLSSDMVFSDGASLELATITGSVSSGLTATLSVAV